MKKPLHKLFVLVLKIVYSFPGCKKVRPDAAPTHLRHRGGSSDFPVSFFENFKLILSAACPGEKIKLRMVDFVPRSCRPCLQLLPATSGSWPGIVI